METMRDQAKPNVNEPNFVNFDDESDADFDDMQLDEGVICQASAYTPSSTTYKSQCARMAASGVNPNQKTHINSGSTNIDTSVIMSIPAIEATTKRLWVKKTWISRRVVVGSEKVASSAQKDLERKVVAKILIDGPDFVMNSCN